MGDGGTIRLLGVSKAYPHPSGEVLALADVSLEIGPGETVALVGPSGAGKSTLLNLIGTLDGPTRGTVEVDGQDLGALEERDILKLRRAVMGFVFQDACLLPSLTIAQNVRLTQTLARREEGPAPEEILAKVGLAERGDHYPNQLSGGEMQRAAVARGLANRPKVILADEPTGHVDSKTAEEIGRLFLDLNRDFGATVIIATHNEDLARLAGRRIRLADGRIVDDSAR